MSSREKFACVLGAGFVALLWAYVEVSGRWFW